MSKRGDGEYAPKMLETDRALGGGWWVSTGSYCRNLAEIITRAEFTGPFRIHGMNKEMCTCNHVEKEICAYFDVAPRRTKQSSRGQG